MALTGTQFASITSSSYSSLHWVGSYALQSQNAITNQSVIRLYGSLYNSNAYGYSYGSDYSTLKVNGTTVYDSSYRAYEGYTQMGYTDITVTHNADGTFPSQSISIYAYSYHFSGQTDTGTISGLPTIDRAAPTVTISLASRTSTSLTVSATASATCDVWEYSTNDGSSFTQFSTTSATSASCTITGLLPNTTYNVKIRARKKSNQVKGTSARGAYTTIGNALLNSVLGFYADASTVTFKPNMTIYGSSFTYTLDIKKSSTTLLTVNIAAQSTGTKDVTVTLSSAQRTTLLSGMSNVASFSATFVLTTYNNGTQVGSTSSATATISTSSSTSAPGQASFSWADTNATTVAVTGDSSKLIQGQSTLRLTSLTATAKNGASIASYNITIGGVTKSSTSGGTVDIGKISQSGTLTLTIVTTDSRGYTSTKTQSITCYAYAPPSITSYSVKRNSTTSTQIDMSMAGTYSNIANNTISASYKYKQTSAGSYGADTAVTLTTTSGTFTYSGSNIATFSDEYVYDFVITLSDGILTETYYITVPSYAPLIAYRPNAVGFGMIPQNTKSVEISQDWRLNANGKLNTFNYMPYSFWTVGQSGTNGYVKIATVNLTGNWIYNMIQFKVMRLVDPMPINLYMAFGGSSSTDPSLSSFNHDGYYGTSSASPIEAFAYKTQASTWEVYVKNYSSGNDMTVFTYVSHAMQNHCNITYSDKLLTSVPSTAVMATQIAPAGVFYGTCSTAGGTSAKVATVNAHYLPLVAGTTVCITFTNLNTATPSSCTLNVNGTGAKSMKIVNNGSLVDLPSMSGGSMMCQNAPSVFVYSGTYWVLISANVDTTYSAMSQSEANTGTATTARTITASVLNTKINNNIDAKVSTLIKDYITERGTSGNWKYEKWNSGKAVCWGSHTVTITSWSSWGSIYEGMPGTYFSYPSGLFNAAPRFLCTPHYDGGGVFGPETYQDNTKDRTPTLYALRPNSTTTNKTCYFDIYAVGTWK